MGHTQDNESQRSTTGSEGPKAEAKRRLDLIKEWFSGRQGGSLMLPNGWFGRPFDNFHRLYEVRADEHNLYLALDGGQLILSFEGPVQISVSNDELTLERFTRMVFNEKRYGPSISKTIHFHSGVVRIVVPPGT